MSVTPSEHLVFSCGPVSYGVPAEAAAEVLPLPALTVVPEAPAHLLGIFVHRGEVLPLVDLSRLAGSPAGDAWTRAVLLRGRTGGVGIATSHVLGVMTFDRPAAAVGVDGLKAQLLGPVYLPGDEVSVIDVDGLLALLARGGR